MGHMTEWQRTNETDSKDPKTPEKEMLNACEAFDFWPWVAML